MSSPLWQRAAAFAARAHQHQHRDDGQTPYFAHCARVVTVLTSVFKCDDEQTIAAAFLHDTIEDTPTDFDEIEERFGRTVARCVAALTKNHLLPNGERERDYDRRLAAADWRTRLIKLADVYDNVLDAKSTAKRRKSAARARRAIALAKVDAARRPEVARAIKAVSRLVRTAGR